MLWKLRILFSAVTSFCLLSCSSEKTPLPEKKITLKMSAERLPKSFDPRQVRELADASYINLLYEGLMRVDDLKVSPGLAESYKISEDGKTYTFKIRKSEWSDGQPVTAYDFYETWKTVLNPEFQSPHAYQFYVIEGAKAVKEGNLSFEKIGIKALDDRTLEVKLAAPNPHFLKLLARCCFFPVCRFSRHALGEKVLEGFATNGPFQLLSEISSSANEQVIVPNPYYWEREKVKLDQVKISALDSQAALHLFDQQELDWIGSPFSAMSAEVVSHFKSRGQLNTQETNDLYFLKLNLLDPLLSQMVLRQVLEGALNRQDLIKNILHGNQKPAYQYLPLFSSKESLSDLDNSSNLSPHKINASLEDSNPYALLLSTPLCLCYKNSGDNDQIAQAIQKQWQNSLQIKIDLKAVEPEVFYDHIKSQDYQIALDSWVESKQDTASFLQGVKHPIENTKITKDIPEYIRLIELAEEVDGEPRQAYLKQAENILFQELPLIPLFYSAYYYVKNQNLKGVDFSPRGEISFRHAYFEAKS